MIEAAKVIGMAVVLLVLSGLALRSLLIVRGHLKYTRPLRRD